MAQTLDQARRKIKTSVHGRRLGLDGDENLVGVKSIRHVVTNATSATTGTDLPNHGFHTVDESGATSADVHRLAAPAPGVPVTIGCASTSTAVRAVIFASGVTCISTNGASGSSMKLRGPGAVVNLVGISTSQYMVTSMTASTLGTSVIQVIVSS